MKLVDENIISLIKPKAFLIKPKASLIKPKVPKFEHVEFIKALIEDNVGIWKDSLAINPLDLANEGGILIWENGKINQFIFTGMSLTNMPENICNI